MEVVPSLSQGRTAAAQCGLLTYKPVPVIFEPPCMNCVLCFIIYCILICAFVGQYIAIHGVNMCC